MIGWILEHFGYLETDHGFVSAWLPPAAVTFDLCGPMPFQVRVAADHDLALLHVECRWPDEVYGPGLACASMLLEDVLDRAADAFVDRVEAEAQASRPFQDTLESVYLGEISPPALDRLELLQDTIRRSRESGDL
jgi:hypothetical protein